MSQDSIERIVSKAKAAKLSLRPPADEHSIERFESEAGLTIPADYRHFLLFAGDGGTEPCRLVRLADCLDSYWIEDPKPHMVSEPCLVTPDAQDHGKQWVEKMNVDNWERRWDDNEWSPMFGTVAVAEIGCGLFFSMIMNGQYRGRIFSWGDHALIPPHFYEERNFGEWIETHLDSTLAGRPVHFLNGRIR